LIRDSPFAIHFYSFIFARPFWHGRNQELQRFGGAGIAKLEARIDGYIDAIAWLDVIYLPLSIYFSQYLSLSCQEIPDLFDGLVFYGMAYFSWRQSAMA